MGDAVVYYRKPLATKDMRSARLSRRVKKMINSVLFLDVTIALSGNILEIEMVMIL